MKQLYFTLLFFTFSAVLTFAQLEIDIADGMTVETTGGIYISGVADVNENSTGYLKGTVESSTLSSATEFAGLTLGTPFSGTITRTTGTAFSSSTPKTFLRSYELNSSSAFTSDVSSKFVSTVGNDEQNGIVTPFIYKKEGTNWTGYNNTSTTANVASANSVNIPSGVSDITISEGIGVAARIFLEGPYTSSAMSTTLNASIPLVSPYSEDPRTAAAVPGNAVDWVLISLRDQTTPATVVSSRAAFVNSDGYIIDDSGALHTGVPAGLAGNYHMSIKHRNHLEVMTNLAQSFDWESN